MRIEGRALCMGADIDTDVIIAGRYLRTKDRAVWAEHAFEDLDPGLADVDLTYEIVTQGVVK